ncbi:hypothetical protein AA983_06690 [Dermacoccus sp. PE3]|nr:hypothetical protein AA983_06690 [Dermacoccus sp. PE3]
MTTESSVESGRTVVEPILKSLVSTRLLVLTKEAMVSSCLAQDVHAEVDNFGITPVLGVRSKDPSVSK